MKAHVEEIHRMNIQSSAFIMVTHSLKSDV